MRLRLNNESRLVFDTAAIQDFWNSGFLFNECRNYLVETRP
jgi:hypothetical protein